MKQNKGAFNSRPGFDLKTVSVDPFLTATQVATPVSSPMTIFCFLFFVDGRVLMQLRLLQLTTVRSNRPS